MFEDLLITILGDNLYNVMLNTNAELLCVFILLLFIMLLSTFTYLIIKIFRLGGGR